MADEPLVITPMPPLVVLLAHHEKQKGAPLRGRSSVDQRSCRVHRATAIGRQADGGEARLRRCFARKRVAGVERYTQAGARMTSYAESIDAAQKVLDAFMAAFNA